MAQRSTINRRSFMSAGWNDSVAGVTSPGGEIASILVQAKPEQLTKVEAAIRAVRVVKFMVAIRKESWWWSSMCRMRARLAIH